MWLAAATLVDSRGTVIRITEVLGGAVDRFGGSALSAASTALGIGWREKVDEIVKRALTRVFGLSTLGFDSNADRLPSPRLNKLVGTVSGMVGGFFGLPGLAVDLPITTAVILRSVAEIARSHGEDISSAEGKRACLEVFTLGGPTIGDEDMEAGYWAARVGLSTLGTGMVLQQAARFLGIALSEKVLAQAIPAIGAVAGGGLNYIFVDYYQQMARVHFTVRELERRSGDEFAVRACFNALVKQHQKQKTVKPRTGA